MNPTPKYSHSSFSILIVFVLLMVVGVSVQPLLNVQLTPSRSLPGLSVSYRWADASAGKIEKEVFACLQLLAISRFGFGGKHYGGSEFYFVLEGFKWVRMELRVETEKLNSV